MDARLMTAMITPFDRDERVDYAEAAKVAQYLVDTGSAGLVVSGTTGESPTLEHEEKLRLFEAVKAAVGDRAVVIAGTGGNNTRQSVELTREAAALGVDGILAVVPYYNKPTQDGMLRHFGAIAEASQLPVIVYNIPPRTGANMLPATLRALAERYPTIAGVKESSGDIMQISTILAERAPGFGVWSGDDYMALSVAAAGGDGVISVAAHIAGIPMREMLEAYARGDVARAGELHRELVPLYAALFSTTSPIPVKWAMNELGFAAGPTRSPLGAMPADLAQRLQPYVGRYRPVHA